MNPSSSASGQQVTKQQASTLCVFAVVLFLVLPMLNCGGGKSSSSPNPPPVQPSTAPNITSISPTSVATGSATFTMTVNGKNFLSGVSTVQWNDSDRITTFVSSSQIKADITSTDVAAAGKANISVINRATKIELSSKVEFSINNPQPVLLSLNPTSLTAGSGATTLILYGRNFISASSVQFGSSNRAGTLINSTRMAVNLTSDDLLNAHGITIDVTNPAPGGGSSGQLTFSVTSPGLSVLTKSLPAASPSKGYDYKLQAEKGVPPFSWETASGSLPGGLNLASNGEISGAPSIADADKTFSFSAKVTDSVSSTASQPLSIRVRSNLGRNDTCGTSTSTPISNGVIRASISPHGDIDTYSFQGNEGNRVSIEIYAQRLLLDSDPASTDVFLDSFLEILDSSCTRIYYNDDLEPGIIRDSSISEYYLNNTGTYYIRVSDLRGDGRPDFIYELHLSGAN